MNLPTPWASYRQVSTQTATPGQLILMLYDGVIRFLGQAMLGFADDDPLEFNRTINNNVLRAQAILHELNFCLNMQDGGEFSLNLRRLYDYLDRRLQESNLQKKPEGIQEVITRINVLREAWNEMLQKQAR